LPHFDALAEDEQDGDEDQHEAHAELLPLVLHGLREDNDNIVRTMFFCSVNMCVDVVRLEQGQRSHRERPEMYHDVQ